MAKKKKNIMRHKNYLAKKNMKMLRKYLKNWMSIKIVKR